MTDDAVWQARLERERNARRAAERLLEARADTLLDINRRSARPIRALLPHALAALVIVVIGLATHLLAGRHFATIATRDSQATTLLLAGALAEDVGRMLEAADLVLRYAEARAASNPRPLLAVPEIGPVQAVLRTDAAGNVVAATHARFLGLSAAGVLDGAGLDAAWGPVLGRAPVAARRLDPQAPEDDVVIPLARPLRDSGGRLIGATLALLDAEAFTAGLARGAHPFQATAVLYASDGTPLAGPGAAPGDAERATPDRWFLPLAAHPGHGRSFIGRDGRGLPMTASIAVTRVIPLVVEVHQPEAVVLRNARDATATSATTAGSVTVAALALIALLARGRHLSASHQATLQALLADQRRSHAELQILIAAMPGTLMRIVPEPEGGWRSTYVAPSFAGLTGSTAHRIGPDWLAARTGPASVTAFAEALRRATTDGEAAAELLLHHGDGGERRLVVRMSSTTPRAEKEAQEETTEIVAIWSDVTRERELERQLVHANKMAQLGEVATGVAHELNQPLTAISMAAENAMSLLAQPVQDVARLRGKLETVVAMITRARDVMDHMRIFGRTDTACVAPVELDRVVRKASALVGERLRRAEVAVTLLLPPDPPRVLAKEVPLEQVMINLLANACDAYLQRAQPGPRPVAVAVGEEAGFAVITVQDRAGGIPPEIVERIFEPFFTTKPVGKGTGLGLSLSFGIVTDLGGTMAVANRDGGALFTIRLPLAPPG